MVTQEVQIGEDSTGLCLKSTCVRQVDTKDEQVDQMEVTLGGQLVRVDLDTYGMERRCKGITGATDAALLGEMGTPIRNPRRIAAGPNMLAAVAGQVQNAVAVIAGQVGRNPLVRHGRVLLQGSPIMDSTSL